MDSGNPGRENAAGIAKDAASPDGSGEPVVPAPAPKTTLSANAPMFVPKIYQQPRNQAGSETKPLDPLDQVKQAIRTLTANPGNFDKTMLPLTQTLNTTIQDEPNLTRIVEEIFCESVREANFRYTGARICNFFTHNLNCQFPNGNFRQHLLQRCHEEHQKRDDLADNCDRKTHLIGFTLFMGELFVNMTVGAKSERMAVLAQALNELLTTLLRHAKEEKYLRCVTQVLKLTGAYLEQTEKSQNADKSTPSMDKVFEELKKCTVDESLQRNVKAMLLSVVELRASDWGGMANKPTTPVTSPGQPPFDVPMGPVYFNAAGNVVSSPGSSDYDRSFTSDDLEHWASHNHQGGEQFENSSEEGGMDDEIAAAFDQFMVDSETERASFYTADQAVVFDQYGNQQNQYGGQQYGQYQAPQYGGHGQYGGQPQYRGGQNQYRGGGRGHNQPRNENQYNQHNNFNRRYQQP